MAYNSQTDALRHLILLRKYGGHVTKSPDSVKTFPNGLPYYYVEVATKDGANYVIEAYGDDATTLRQESLMKPEEFNTVA